MVGTLIVYDSMRYNTRYMTCQSIVVADLKPIRYLQNEVRILKKIKLGVSELNASRIGLGVMRMGTRSDLEAQKAFESAIGNGINFFEYANIYGNGQSSSVFGRALKNANVARDSILIQSKGGIVRGDGFKRVDFSKANLIQSVEDELSRIGTDYLDVFVLHRPDVLVEPSEVAEAFNYLRKVVKYVTLVYQIKIH